MCQSEQKRWFSSLSFCFNYLLVCYVLGYFTQNNDFIVYFMLTNIIYRNYVMNVNINSISHKSGQLLKIWTEICKIVSTHKLPYTVITLKP